MQSSAGTGGIPYEYSVVVPITSALRVRRAIYVLVCAVWCLGLIAIAFFVQAMLPFAAVGVLPMPFLLFILWKRTQTEYEYSFFSGTLTVSRIHGKRWRRTLEEIPLRSLCAVFPCDTSHSGKAEQYRPVRSILAASSMDAPGLYALLWQEEDGGETVLLWAELTEKALKTIRFYNRPAVLP